MISAVVLTKNEENNIERCLKSVAFCDEIIVIDDYSTDNTLGQISKIKYQNNKLKIKIFKRQLNEDFARQRNFGLEKATGDWVLFLDVDEEVSEELKKEIQNLLVSYHSLSRETISAFYIKRRDFWWGRELKWGEVKKIREQGSIRLVRKKSGEWVGKVHEEFKLKTQNSKLKTLKNYINHYPHPTLKDFLQEINFYSTLRAKELFNQRKKTNILEIIFYPLGKFILNYFIYLGFLDGPAGFAYAFLMSFHSFLVRAKLYQYERIDSVKSKKKIE